MENEVKAGRQGPMIIFAGAAAGLVVAIYASLRPLGPQADSAAAWSLALSTFLLALAARALPALQGRLTRNLLRVVMLLGILGIAFTAAYLRHFWLDIAMLIAFLGWLVDLHQSKTPHR
ncbi:hypothetical protein FGG78_28240 [Thioclava sp. BHET1]|nr:hypothetical protein FGG78_28240 [Thioclava sp. BHET1]